MNSVHSTPLRPSLGVRKNMNKVLTSRDIKEMSPEDRKKVADAMIVPIRCGGTEYINGELHYRLGGWLVPSSVVTQGWPAINQYRNTHPSYLTAEHKTRRRQWPL